MTYEDEKIQTVLIVIRLMISETHMNILFIIKVKILMLI